MDPDTIVGWTLLLGAVVFLVGAGAWRLDYEKPMAEALTIIASDRRRRAWIHLWMIPAMLITAAGLAGLVVVVQDPTAVVWTAMAAATWGLGAVCWVVSLAFRLTVVPWAADETVGGGVPPAFPPLDAWASSLYAVHMLSGYAAFALLGAGVLADGVLSSWVGWLGIGWGTAFTAGMVATRFSGPFNPPFWTHTYTAMLGVLLLLD